ncbi:MAG: hypothetical protein JO362_09490 [Streptomycetaceae bacterium]|nr:hypothetical protein [Streptomycetaceae bacterium]
MKRFGAVPSTPWTRWALLWGVPCAAIALGAVGVALTVGVRSADGTALVIVASIGALFAFTLTMPRRGRDQD